MESSASPSDAAPCCAEVVLDGGQPAAPLTYAVPEHLASDVSPGTAVIVPLGKRRVTGIVLAKVLRPAFPGLRPIEAVRPDAGLPPDLIELIGWAAGYYQVPPGTLLRSILPVGIRRRSRRRVLPIPGAVSEKPGTMRPLLAVAGEEERDARMGERILARIPPQGIDLATLRRELGPPAIAATRRLAARGLVSIEDVPIERRAEASLLRATGDSGEALRRSPRQAEIHRFILDREPQPVLRAEIELRFPGSSEIVRRLLARGLLFGVPEGRAPSVGVAPQHHLRRGQETALAALLEAQRRFETFLLFGVTASGKTEVYLRAAAAVHAAGRSVLLLVPEIGLTPQLIAQARRLFPGKAAVLHSGLGDLERARTWHEVLSGQATVVIGARSAVFAPLSRLGLIVVDEEHDAAYKQEESPRYNARDMAVMRGKLAGCPVVLASATPSLESFRATEEGRYRLLELSERATESALPVVELIDLRSPSARPRQAALPGSRSERSRAPVVLSPSLAEAIVENYRAGEQTLLFLNRRGYARFIQCEECGYVLTCRQCSVSLTVHRTPTVATCHHCGFTARPASRCPECDALLVGRSFGTQQVETAVHALLPAARVARLDRDTGSSPAFLHGTLAGWRRGELDVLVGTQMIAKGHDAPGVTLIGVILADASLHFPDFRAAERTFQLLAQVAGRAGRGAKPGRVLVQTRNPEHPSLVAAARHDFRAFAASELPAREMLRYPPFGRLARIVLEGEQGATERRARQASERLRSAAGSLADAAGDSLAVLGPAPAPIERLRGRFRMQLLVKARDARKMGRILAMADLHGTTAVRTIVDVDPISML